ncbi:ribosomal large subunit pseudouridine synthase B, partial [Stenotrophomonas maltophilia]
PRRSGPRGG